jgi:hypothetical protein
VLLAEREAEWGQQLTAARRVSVVWIQPPFSSHLPCWWLYDQQRPRGMAIFLLMDGREEERTIDGCSTEQLYIVQLPMITITVCLVGGWMINDNHKWRRTTILLAQEEEWTMQWRPHVLERRMEPHQIAQLMRLTKAQRRRRRRGGATSFGRSMKAMAINGGNGYIQWGRLLMTYLTTAIDKGYQQLDDGDGVRTVTRTATVQGWQRHQDGDIGRMAINDGYQGWLLPMVQG